MSAKFSLDAPTLLPTGSPADAGIDPLGIEASYPQAMAPPLTRGSTRSRYE